MIHRPVNNRPDSDTQIRISVCMAVHNGANFIRDQIASILPQLGPRDEFIIVDDASEDDTCTIVDRFADNRIRVIRQERNQGVVRSFGRSLTNARGQIVFLADHDDIWREDKVEKYLAVFDRHPDVTVVMSDLVVIDATGRRIGGPKFGYRGVEPGILHNLIRNNYQGSAMAFRASVLDYCLPFPEDIPIHDVWIGLVNQFVGKAAFIPEPLLLYRRHGMNDSPDRHAPIPQMIRWRWALMKNLALLYMRKLAWGHRL